MRDVIIVAMWNTENSTGTRSVVVTPKSKELKMNGKKPNIIIIPESCVDIKLLRKVKSLGAYNCKIVTATGK